jgi:outer membrane protein assembly factor BamB
MRRLIVAALLVSVGFTACAKGSPTEASAASTASPSVAQKPLWKTSLGARGFVAQLDTGGDTIVATGGDNVQALEARTGARRWRYAAAEPKSLAADGTVFVATPLDLAALALRDGSVRWKIGSPCPATPATGKLAALPLLVAGNDLYLGCPDGGRLARVDVRNGSVRAKANGLPLFQYVGATDLGNGVFAATGYSAGAAIMGHTGLFARDDLRPIAPAWTDATVLGAIDGMAMVDDWCCFGRPQDKAPATLLRVDLRTGVTREAIDLQPDPTRFGPDRRGLGDGANALLVGSSLYLTLLPELFDYGDVRNPASSPLSVAGALLSNPIAMTNGRVVVRRKVTPDVVDEVLDLTAHPARVVWQRRATSPYEQVNCSETVCSANVPADLVLIAGRPEEPALILRWDGATATVPASCRAFVANGENVVAACAEPKLDEGNTFDRYVGAFALARPTH